MEAGRFDRASEDLANIVNLGHVNFRHPDQGLATTFYVTGLGLTRDPYMMTGTANMWVNVGESQFHLPTGPATVAAGLVTLLVVPDLDALVARLERVRKELADTRFAFRQSSSSVEVTCPWGNRLCCLAPDEARFGPFLLSLAGVEFEVGRGAAAPIARFYREIMKARVILDGSVATVSCGQGQVLCFAEKDAPSPACIDHHIQIYLADFSGPYRRLREAGIRVDESSRHQYRFTSIIDLATSKDIFVLDHEVRAMTHPMYGRKLVNRDASQTINTYRAGHDEFTWRM